MRRKSVHLTAAVGLLLGMSLHAVRADDAADKPLAIIASDTPGVHIDILSSTLRNSRAETESLDDSV